MFGLFLRSPQRLATSSGSTSLNSPLLPSHAMQELLLGSESSSNRNCHSWICPLPVGLFGEGMDPASGVEHVNEVGLLGVEQVEYSDGKNKLN